MFRFQALAAPFRHNPVALRDISAWVLVVLFSAALAACSGSDDDGGAAGRRFADALRAQTQVPQAQFSHGAPASLSAAAALPTSAPTANEFMDWLQAFQGSAFPSGASSQTVVANGVSYTLRYYFGTGNTVAVSNQDGTVYIVGAFSGGVLRRFGRVSDYTCDVKGGCVRFSPDAEGNLSAGAAGALDATVRGGDAVQFLGLTANDAVVEVGSGTLSGKQLCSDPALPAGGAHSVPAQNPLPASFYARNEISGPYRTFPAGIYPMSAGTGECGFIEKTSACSAPNEVAAGSQAKPGGGAEYLCSVTPFLMNPANPSLPANSPPQANPACVRNKVLDSVWADAAVQGVFLRLSWKDINPSYGSYDWTSLDREFIAALRNGKTVTFGIEVGGNSIPDWAFATGDPVLGPVRKVQLRDWGTAADSYPNSNCGFEYAVASPSDAAFKSLFKKALADTAAHIRADQRLFSVLAGVKVTGLGMATLENRLPARCNIAVRNSALGDSGTQGHIISMATTNLNSPTFDAKYNQSSDPTLARIKDVSSCVCNPQVLAAAGYRPSNLRSFYNEIEATMLQNYGYKQQTFMNVSDGFPQIGESGRFLGDHLKPVITSMGTDAAGQPVYAYGGVQAKPAVVGSDIPDRNDGTAALLADARAGVFAGGDLTKARAFGVENAGLDVVGFSLAPNQGSKCSQQNIIDVSGAYPGSALFPISASTPVDPSGYKCPNWLATTEGIAHHKVTGFQVAAGVGSATDLDEALWNMTLNTNGVFFEPYEVNAWRARTDSALNAGLAWSPSPAVTRETATVNYTAAVPKSGAQWNALLLARAKALAADPANANSFQANPFPSDYVVTIESAPNTKRYFFNSRACIAYAARGTPVRVNTLTIAN